MPTGGKKDFSKNNTNRKRERSQSFGDRKNGPKKFAANKQGKPHAQPTNPKEARKVQQEKREYRKSLRTHHDLVTQAKTYWERIRDTVNVTTPERKKLIEELLNLIEGLLMDLIRKHDGSRIIQTCIKYGSAEQRKKIFKELEGHFLELAQKKYSRFLVNRFLDSASKEQKESIFKEFYGNVISMITHKEACEVIEKAYQQSSGIQKTLFVEEFYGNEYALFKTTKSRKLEDILKENPEKEEQIMKSIMDSINTLLTKGLIYLSISHHVLNEFYDNASPEKIREMTSLLSPELIHTVRTRYGSQVAVKCVGYATAKERKIIIKSLKGSVGAICQEPNGHMFIVKLLDVTDDTVLLSKAILREMLENADHLVTDGNGRLPFLQVLAPEENRTRYFAPPSMKLLEPNLVPGPDNTLVSSSKKDSEVRRKELLASIDNEIVEYCSEHVSDMISDKFGFAVLLETLLNAESNKKNIIDEILKLVKKGKDNENHVLIDPVASRFIKTLITTDFTYNNNEINFAEEIFKIIESQLLYWSLKAYSSAIVIALLKNSQTSKQAIQKLKPNRSKLEKEQKSVRGVAHIITLLQ